MNRSSQRVLLSPNSFALIASAVVTSLLGIEVVKAQPQPSCFMINPSGEVLDLTTICNQKPQRQLNNIAEANNSLNSAFIDNGTAIPNPPVPRVYFVGNGNTPFTLGTSSTTYYSSDRPAYVRRYQETARFSNRDDARNSLLVIGVDPTRANVSNRNPFIIYRYQK